MRVMYSRIQLLNLLQRNIMHILRKWFFPLQWHLWSIFRMSGWHNNSNRQTVCSLHFALLLMFGKSGHMHELHINILSLQHIIPHLCADLPSSPLHWYSSSDLHRLQRDMSDLLQRNNQLHLMSFRTISSDQHLSLCLWYWFLCFRDYLHCVPHQLFGLHISFVVYWMFEWNIFGYYIMRSSLSQSKTHC